MSSIGHPRDNEYDSAPKALLRSGIRGILAVTFAVVAVGLVAAVIAVVVALTF